MRRGLLALITAAATAAAMAACTSDHQPTSQPAVTASPPAGPSAVTTSSPAATGSPSAGRPAVTARTTTARPAVRSGIDGQTVMVTCPVDRGDPPCPATPVQARLAVLDAAGRTVATVDTDAQGRFSVPAPAGAYLLRSVTVGGHATRPDELPVTVADGRYTTIVMRLIDGRR